MFRYEVKKVFSSKKNKIALILLALIIGVTCYFAMDVTYTNEEGESESGIGAVRQLRAAQKEWSGWLDRSLLNCSYARGFREYDYYLSDSLSESRAGEFYENRTKLLKEWIEEDGVREQFSDEEKKYLIRQYETIETPFYYDYMKGWVQLFQFSPTIIMITMLFLGYLVAGIFANEFAWRADDIFYGNLLDGDTDLQRCCARLSGSGRMELSRPG